jgi:hypothetical protein
MQRFHFENCNAIPPQVLRVYKSLKTTRPRGVGSPQSYWDKSARELGLIDSDCGIAVRDGSVLMQRKMEENHTGGAAPIPSLMGLGQHAEMQEQGAGPWIENAVGVTTPQEDEDQGEEKPCEADASILLMLKNPDASSPKSDADDAAAKEECKLAEV